MTLKIQTEQDEQRQLLMTIEVPEERVEKQMRQTARKLAKEVKRLLATPLIDLPATVDCKLKEVQLPFDAREFRRCTNLDLPC